MNRKEQRSSFAASTMLKFIASIYLIVISIFLLKEYLIDRTDAADNTMIIIGGIIVLIAAVFLLISAFRGIGVQRDYVKKHGVSGHYSGDGIVYPGGTAADTAAKKSTSPPKKKKKKKR